MKKFSIVFGALLLTGLVLAGCSNPAGGGGGSGGGGGGKLIINGTIPLDNPIVYVFPNPSSAPSIFKDYSNATSATTTANSIQAMSMDSKSPFSLIDTIAGDLSAFAKSGTYMVVIRGTKGLSPAADYYLMGVIFTGGSATVNAGDFLNSGDLPPPY